MPTQRLIDINTAVITYRTKILTSLDKKLYKNCIGGIETMNGDLPVDDGEFVYRIIFDDKEYYKLRNSVFKIICTKCEHEHDYDSVQIVDMALSFNEKIMTQQNSKKVWICKKCTFINDLTISKILKNKMQYPFYSRYVPNPPKNNHGLLDNLEYHSQMVEWVWICLKSLEDAFARFRDDNWNKGGNIPTEDSTINTDIEEGKND
jgi:hypothetical protein